jgi:hypothetical protein
VARSRAFFGWDDSVPLETSAWPSRGARLGVGLLAAAILGLELRAIAGPHEDWPFSSAPMFAYYHDAGSPLFELELFAEVAPGRERRIEPRTDLGIGQIAFKRLLFADHYGSTDPVHPAGHHENDSPERFRRRMSEFCRKVARVFAQRTGTTPRSIRVELSRIEQQRDARGVLEVKGVSERRTLLVVDVAPDRSRSE